MLYALIFKLYGKLSDIKNIDFMEGFLITKIWILCKISLFDLTNNRIF